MKNLTTSNRLYMINYNMHFKQDLKFAQIEKLHRNENGILLTTAPTIKRTLEELSGKWNK